MATEREIMDHVLKFARTRELCGRAVRESPNDIKAVFGAGVGFRLTGDHANALAQFERAARLQPGNHLVLFELAGAQEALGRFDDAIRSLREAVRIAPSYYKAQYALVQLEKQTAARNAIPSLENLFTAPDDDGWRSLHIGHALAKAHEDLGNLPESFAWLGRAKARRRAMHPYLPSTREALTDAAMAATGLLPKAAPGFVTDEPIFVCGMARTGTTLVDRILSSHPDVASAGELTNFFQTLKLLSPSKTRVILDPETMLNAAQADFERLGRLYVDSTRPLTGATRRFIDKAPSNYLIAGTILKALPNARIICLRRHPLDTVLSNYKQIFPIDDRYYDYVYDLGAAAHQYVQFDRVVRHMQAALPPDRFMVVEYEALVARQEEQTRALLAFCGLAWDPRCLEFHKSAGGVATPSAKQVRQAMYASSSGRWEAYGALLDPARAVLQAFPDVMGRAS